MKVSISHSFLLFGLVLPTLLCCSRVFESSYLDLKVIESTPEGRHLRHYPADGVKVGVNPPGFTWTSHDSANNYCFVLFQDTVGEKIHLTRKGLTSTVAPLKERLKPGEYSWHGKLHLEMHWWHGVHFALWQKEHVLEKQMEYYPSIYKQAKILAGV